MRGHPVERVLLMLSIVLLILTIDHVTHADPVDTSNVHLKSTSTCTTAKGSTVALPPGYFLDEAKFAALDTEVRRAQDAETRLTAENGVLRTSVAGWQPGWKTLAISFAAGAALILSVEHL